MIYLLYAYLSISFVFTAVAVFAIALPVEIATAFVDKVVERDGESARLYAETHLLLFTSVSGLT